MRNPSTGVGSLLIFLGFSLAATCHAASSPIPESGLSVVWTATQPSTVLKVLSREELKKLKKSGSSETDPTDGKKEHFEGLLLSDLIDKALNGTSNDRKAAVDLIVLKNSHGAKALIPRSFIVKYPVILATTENHKSLPSLKSIIPWTSKSRTKSEGLPLETYFIDDVNEVELGNYRERYGNVFLKNRQDPTAMRGEKIFIQSCLSCHDSEPGISKAKNWIGQHPTLKGVPNLDSREQRALHGFLDSLKAETAPVAAH